MSSILAPQPTKAITPENAATIAVISTGPAIYGLYKFCKWVKSTKTGKTVAKGIGAVTTGLGAWVASRAAADFFSEANWAYNNGAFDRGNSYHNGALLGAALSCGLGLSSCLLAESTIKDLKNTTQNNN